MRMVSEKFMDWLIVINIAIFALANINSYPNVLLTAGVYILVFVLMRYKVMFGNGN